jgi:hypothetical protein
MPPLHLELGSTGSMRQSRVKPSSHGRVRATALYGTAFLARRVLAFHGEQKQRMCARKSEVRFSSHLWTAWLYSRVVAAW